MTDVINLAKEKAEKVTISLAKKGLTKLPTMRVLADLDISGSMNGLYSRGVVEEVFKRLIGYALTFDDNGEIEVVAFDERPHELPGATASDFGSYIGKHVKRLVGGGTQYAPTVAANLAKLFPKAGTFANIFSKAATSAKDPALVLFFTDGDTSTHDVNETGKLLGEAEKSGKPVYFHLIGIGTGATFQGLKKLADDYDNCGFIHMRSIEMTDEQMYDALATEEFLAFLKKHGAA